MGVVGAVRPVNLRWTFTVEVDGVVHAGFQKMSALEAEVAQIDYFEGGNARPIKLPGRVTVSDVTLSRGAGLDDELYEWFLQVVDIVRGGGLVSPEFKRSLDLVQRGRDGREIKRWEMNGAWPKKFTAGEWDNDSDEPVIEEIVLAVDDFRKVT
jgi:phage tail-like protein